MIISEWPMALKNELSINRKMKWLIISIFAMFMAVGAVSATDGYFAFDTSGYFNKVSDIRNPSGTILNLTGSTPQWNGGNICILNNNNIFTQDIDIKKASGSSNFNLIGDDPSDDGTGANYRSSFTWWTDEKNIANNRALSVQTHANITQNHDITFYSNLKDNVFSGKAFQWYWNTDADGIFQMVHLNRIEFPEEWTGFFSNESNSIAGFDVNDEDFIIDLDSNNDGTDEDFQITKNNRADTILSIDGSGGSFNTNDLDYNLEGSNIVVKIGSNDGTTHGVDFGSSVVEIKRISNDMYLDAYNEMRFNRRDSEVFRIDTGDDIQVNSGHNLIVNGYLYANDVLTLGSPESQTISNDSISFASSNMYLDTESSASTDDLSCITGGSAGAKLEIRTASSSRDITLKHGTCGSASQRIYLNGKVDFTLDSTIDRVICSYESFGWICNTIDAN